MSINYSTFLTPLEPSQYKSTNNITYKIVQLEAKATSLNWTWNIEDVTVIRMDGPGSLSKVRPLTIHTAFSDTVESSSSHIALKYKFSQEEKFKEMSFGDYYRLSCMVAKSFIKIGLEPRNSVCIAGFNSPPWHLSYMGTIFAAGVASGVYTTNNAETILYILNNCSCQIAVVENKELLERYLDVSAAVPKLKALIQYSGNIDADLKARYKVSLYEWHEFMDLGTGVPDKMLVDRLQSLLPNECCSLIYTSGTTGNPKGVMMSHDNLTWTAKCLATHINFRPAKEELISYLPLSHVAAQMCDIILPLMVQASVYFAQPDALKGTLGKTLKEVRPTYFIGVPRVFEKISEQMREIGLSMSSLKQSLSAWAKNIGLRTNLAIMHKEPTPYCYTLAKTLIYNKVRANLGLDRCIGLFSAAAPISTETLHYFASLDMVICEIYGMSECSGPQSVGSHQEFLFGSVGKIFVEFDNKIFSKEGDFNEGEVCMRGRHVFMGYLGTKEKTEETFDKDNWLHSGDVGTVNKDGFLIITGRIKELIITAGGENIAPVPLEEKLKEILNFVSSAIVVGDQKKFLAVLLTIKCETDPDSQLPTDELRPSAKRWFRAIDYQVDHVSQVINDKNPKVWSAIEEALKITNQFAVSKAAYLQKWTFLPVDFSVAGGELGPTMKVKRGVVTKMYSKLIDDMYRS